MRERAARAVQAVFAALGLPAGHATRRSTAATHGYDSARPARPRPRRRRRGGRRAARATASSALDVALALDRRGLRGRGRGGARDAAPAGVGRLPADLGDDRRRTGSSARRSTTRTRYPGPGTGYRLEGERWELLQALPHVVDPRQLGDGGADGGRRSSRSRAGDAGDDPARGRRRRRARRSGTAFARRSTASAHGDVLAAVVAGVREAGASAARRARPARRRRRVHRATTARASRARGSRSGSSRRARRSSTEPTCSRSTTSSCSGWPAVHARQLPRDGPQRGGLRARPAASGRCRRSSTTSRARS